MNKDTKLHLTLLGMFALVCGWSFVAPFERFTWWLEATPVLAGVAVLIVTYKRFRFTNLVYLLVLAHCVILLIGAHYTYAETPLFNLLRDQFQLGRNNYDKVGHFAQGFIPAIIIREVLLRRGVIARARSGWLFVIVTSIALAISAFYEFVEWWSAVLTGDKADSFLGTQGYIWDTQSDMFMAFIGAMLAQLIFKCLHDKEIKLREAQGITAV